MKKLLFILIFLVGLTFSAVIIFVIHAKLTYQDFYSNSSRLFEIPQIHSGFTPQGIDYYENENLFLLSGYNQGNTSKIFVVYPDQSYREISILDTDGKELNNHAGGLCSYGKYIYLAGCDGKCYILSQDFLKDCKINSTSVIDTFDTYNNADFCYIKDNQLYIGEYYYPLMYKTKNTHHFRTPAGDENNALITVFALANDLPFGVSNMPIAVYSITDAVQGMCITDDKEIILSTSVFFAGSRLHYYDFDSLHNKQCDIFTINSVSVPLYYLDNEVHHKTKIIPPKSEGIFYHDQEVCKTQLE